MSDRGMQGRSGLVGLVGLVGRRLIADHGVMQVWMRRRPLRDHVFCGGCLIGHGRHG